MKNKTIYLIFTALLLQVTLLPCHAENGFNVIFDSVNNHLEIINNGNPRFIFENDVNGIFDKKYIDENFKNYDNIRYKVFSNNDTKDIVPASIEFQYDAKKYFLIYADIQKKDVDTARIVAKRTVKPKLSFQDNADSSSSKWWILTSALIVIAAAAYFFVKNKILIMNKIKLGNSKPDDNIMVVEEVVGNDFIKGLEHVMSDIDNYYIINADEIYQDTAIKNVYVSCSLIKQMYDFFKKSLENSSRTNETGCYAIGCWDYSKDGKKAYDISLEYLVEPGDDAILNEYTLNFGHEIGIRLGDTIYKLSAKTKRNYVHCAWIHSHPGLGLFLSNHDLIVQKQLADPDNKNRMLAIVIDTNSANWETALFTSKINGTMNNRDDAKKMYSLDSMYRWSRGKNIQTADIKPVGTPAKTKSNPDYYCFETNDAAIESINFSGKAINQIDEIVYENKTGVSGFFYGNSGGKEIFVDNCLRVDNVQIIGCLVIDSSSIDKVLANYKDVISDSMFIVVYRSDSEMPVCLKNNDGKFSSNNDFVKTMSLDKMKEWIRRKRI